LFFVTYYGGQAEKCHSKTTELAKNKLSFTKISEKKRKKNLFSPNSAFYTISQNPAFFVLSFASWARIAKSHLEIVSKIIMDLKIVIQKMGRLK
jgi:hypothetical protein